MKATLQFNLPDETTEHLDALHGTDWKMVAWSLDNTLRGWQKHEHNFKDANSAIDMMREFLHQEISNRGLLLD